MTYSALLLLLPISSSNPQGTNSTKPDSVKTKVTGTDKNARSYSLEEFLDDPFGFVIKLISKIFSSDAKDMSEREVVKGMPGDPTTGKVAEVATRLAAVLRENPIYDVVQEVLTKNELHFAPEIESLGLEGKSENDIRNEVLKFISKKRLNSLVKQFGEKNVKIVLTGARFEKVQAGSGVIKKEELESLKAECRDRRNEISLVARKRVNQFYQKMEITYGKKAVEEAKQTDVVFEKQRHIPFTEWEKKFERGCVNPCLEIFFEQITAIKGEEIVKKAKEGFPKFILGKDKMDAWQNQFIMKCDSLYYIEKVLEEINLEKTELFKYIDFLESKPAKTDLENAVLIKNLFDLIRKNYTYKSPENVLYIILMRSNFAIPKELVSDPVFLTRLFNNAIKDINKANSEAIKNSRDLKNLIFKNAREVLNADFEKAENTLKEDLKAITEYRAI